DGIQTDIKGIRAALERVERGRDILGSPDFWRGDFKAERAGRCLNPTRFQHGEAISDIAHNRQTAETKDNLAQKLEAVGSKIGGLTRQPRDVAAWSRQTGNEAGINRVARRREHYRNDCCRFLRRKNWWGS